MRVERRTCLRNEALYYRMWARLTLSGLSAPSHPVRRRDSGALLSDVGRSSLSCRAPTLLGRDRTPSPRRVSLERTVGKFRGQSLLGSLCLVTQSRSGGLVVLCLVCFTHRRRFSFCTSHRLDLLFFTSLFSFVCHTVLVFCLSHRVSFVCHIFKVFCFSHTYVTGLRRGG